MQFGGVLFSFVCLGVLRGFFCLLVCFPLCFVGFFFPTGEIKIVDNSSSFLIERPKYNRL